MIDQDPDADSGVYIGDMRVRAILLHHQTSRPHNNRRLKYGRSVLI
jgi:hypothetical protein